VLSDDSAELAASLRDEDPDASALAFLYRAVDHVRSSLEYRLGTTTVNSSVAEVLAGGSGVCQDFAHVLISLCRNVGLPARYVSGYLGGVESSTASHAWTEAYVPPYGWVGVDATLGTRCTGRHVIVGIGRDYADVAVLSGTYQGGGQATLDVQVVCETLGGSDAMAQLRGGSAPIARLVAYGHAGIDPKIMGLGPVSAVKAALAKAGLKIGDIDVIESNEAFAAQALGVNRQLDLDPAKVNPNGGLSPVPRTNADFAASPKNVGKTSPGGLPRNSS